VIGSRPGEGLFEHGAIVDWTSNGEIGWLYGRFSALRLKKSKLAFSAWASMGRKES